MDSFLLEYGRYIWVVVALLVAVLVDYGLARLVMEFVRPVSSAAFWAGRAGKIGAVITLILFFNLVYWPKVLAPASSFAGPGPLPGTAVWIETGAVLVLAAIAGLTLPRGRKAKGEVDA